MIQLTRRIRVSTFEVEATVAVGRDRPEFLAVARLAADLGRPIYARDVLRELLGPRPEVLGWRVIERCVALGLLEPTGTDGGAVLSAAGRLALSHGQVLVPEEGIWRFFVADDPLVPTAIVHAQRLEAEPVRKEREAMKIARSRGESRAQPDRPSELLRRGLSAPPGASVENGQLMQLIELAEKGAAGPNGELRLALTLDAGPTVRLTGHLPSDEHGVKSRPVDAVLEESAILGDLTYEGLWRMLVVHATQVPGAVLDRWRTIAGRPVVPASFLSLPATARHAFRGDIDVPASEWPGLGRFEPTIVKDVGIVPASETDAGAWLAWLQWEAINDYVTPGMIDQQSRDLLALFPHHRPRALGAADLLSRARIERDERSWFLLGPHDLGLWS